MTVSSADLLSSLLASDRPRRVVTLGVGMVPMKIMASAADLAVGPPKRRTNLWDMHQSVHCSIIGTCLSAGELRRLMVKLGVEGATAADDHALHKQAVVLAGHPQDGGKLIQKALDRRHEVAVRQCARIKDETGLVQFWQAALQRGEVPGAYWAVLSHPAAGDALMRRAFGDVHMLSHMVGAANRADIRRLRHLEDENAALSEQLERQQQQLRDGFVARDDKIRLLNEALGRALAQAPVAEHAGDDAGVTRDALLEAERRSNREAARRERLEQRIKALTLAVAAAERGQRRVEQENHALRSELALVETQFEALLGSPPKRIDALPPAKASPLADAMPAAKTLLYVGGRIHQVPQLRAMVERAGGAFLHHDGGIEHAATLLPGLISRADCAVFPVDCISHDAMATVKRLCRQASKPFIPLRTSSAASLLAGLATLQVPLPAAAP
jgi:hypothetical protein